MKGKNIEKWKEEGVREFLMESCGHQMAKNQLNGVEDFKLLVPHNGLKYLVGYLVSIPENFNNDTGIIVIMGKKVELY